MLTPASIHCCRWCSQISALALFSVFSIFSLCIYLTIAAANIVATEEGRIYDPVKRAFLD